MFEYLRNPHAHINDPIIFKDIIAYMIQFTVVLLIIIIVYGSVQKFFPQPPISTKPNGDEGFTDMTPTSIAGLYQKYLGRNPTKHEYFTSYQQITREGLEPIETKLKSGANAINDAKPIRDWAIIQAKSSMHSEDDLFKNAVILKFKLKPSEVSIQLAGEEDVNRDGKFYEAVKALSMKPYVSIKEASKPTGSVEKTQESFIIPPKLGEPRTTKIEGFCAIAMNPFGLATKPHEEGFCTKGGRDKPHQPSKLANSVCVQNEINERKDIIRTRDTKEFVRHEDQLRKYMARTANYEHVDNRDKSIPFRSIENIHPINNIAPSRKFESWWEKIVNNFVPSGPVPIPITEQSGKVILYTNTLGDASSVPMAIPEKSDALRQYNDIVVTDTNEQHREELPGLIWMDRNIDQLQSACASKGHTLDVQTGKVTESSLGPLSVNAK